MKFFIQLVNRVCEWLAWRVPRPVMTIEEVMAAAAFHQRSHAGNRLEGGMRVYSLCGCCGTPLGTSATLCDSCAHRRSPSRPNA